jgi:alpha-1,2-glucosyltransferase
VIGRDATRDQVLDSLPTRILKPSFSSCKKRTHLLTMAKSRAPEPSNSIIAIPSGAVLLYGVGALCLHLWLNQVCQIVPEPYLDEVFHIPQAQTYWAGSWQRWDPKITTPPGLYLYSYLFAKVYAVFGNSELSVRRLRISVEVLLVVLPLVLLRCHPRYHKYNQWSPKLFAQIMHSNLNIMLCPLLFFFSALYYTDVLSAFAVMEVYRWYVFLDSDQAQGNHIPSSLSTGARSATCKIAIFSLGLFAMLVRQTNVFWVAVFLGGLQAVKALSSSTRGTPLVAGSNAKVSANRDTIYDPQMHDAAIDGMLRTFGWSTCT